MITQAEFNALATQGYTRIPVVREVFSDLDTPLSVYLKLADGPHTFLFESVEGGESGGAIRSSACRRDACTRCAPACWRQASWAR
ncbi:anthranilate synthase component I [mine drainage metagenome]|uniref:Anthranilate synthase component I n=1 Tax=mine drainage metagenome TaxID=410659 RepID=T1DC96_9ZZZZ